MFKKIFPAKGLPLRQTNLAIRLVSRKDTGKINVLLPGGRARLKTGACVALTIGTPQTRGAR